MDIFILIGILLVNVIAILIVYHFIKQLNNKQKVIIIAIGIAINYIFCLLYTSYGCNFRNFKY